MDKVEKAGIYIVRLLFFVFLTIIFIPSFLIVNYLQKYWTDEWKELF